MSNSFNDRQLIEISTKQIEDIVDPQYTVIVGSRADGVSFKVDIGRVCYTNQERTILVIPKRIKLRAILRA